MSKVVRVDKENLSAELTMTITKDDYVPKLDSELKGYLKKAHMKGFRKGKIPMGVIRKMYGQSLLAEVINDTLQKSLTKYLTDENIEILGQPIPSDDQVELNFDIAELQDFEFKFDIGLAPEFEVQGLSKDTSFDRYAIEVSSSMLDKEIEQAKTKFGERESVDTIIEDNDVVTFDAEELEGDKVKENGWASSFSVLVNKIGDEAVKEEILKKKKGDKIKFNVYSLEADAKPETVKKYMLNITEKDEEVQIGEEFEGTIKEVQRIMPAEVNEAFFDKAFGEGKVKSIEEARSKFEEEITKYYDKQAESLLFRDIQDSLLALNNVEVPNDFLKRWLKTANEQATEEVIENEYENFAKNLQWSLIKGKIVQKFDLSVAEEEIFESFNERIRGYFQGYGDELIILNTANRMMEDKKQVDQLYQELMSDKLFVAVREVVAVNDKKISTEDFDAVIKKAHDEVKATQNIAQIEAPEEEVTEDVG
jgi:trigger factor